MFGSDDSRLHEEDFIFVPEFRSYLEGYRKTSGTRLARKTINRQMQLDKGLHQFDRKNLPYFVY